MKKAPLCILLLVMTILLSALPLWAQQEVPEAAQRHLLAGVALIEKAEKPADFLGALVEFESAAALAPQWPDIQYNLAKLAAETDRPAKAIKAYRAYLALSPAASDRAAVEQELARMNELTAQKRKIGLPGIKFASMADGIAVLEINPGTRIAKSGLQKGDKIVFVNGKSVVGMKLHEFFATIEASNLDSLAKATTERLLARMSRGDKTSGPVPVVMLKIKRPGLEVDGLVPCKKDMFRSHLLEIEEEEFEAEVLKEKLPVVVTFWSSECQPCSEFLPTIEAESGKYQGKVKFVNINSDDNRRLAQQLQIKGVPTLMVFREGAPVSSDTGNIAKEKVDELLKNLAAK